MSEHDGRELLSISQLAIRYNLDRRTVSLRLAGVNPAVNEGQARKYFVDEVHDLLTTNTAEKDAKERKLAAEAEKAEIAVAKLKGELVSVAEMTSAVHDILKSLYQRLVVVAPRVLARGDAELEIRIRDFNAKVFDEVRANPLNFLNKSYDGSNTER